MFFQVSEKLFETIVLALAVRGDNCPISYKIGQVLAIIPPVSSCLFAVATGFFTQNKCIKHGINQWCPNFSHSRSTFLVATIPRSTSPVSTLKSHSHHFQSAASN